MLCLYFNIWGIRKYENTLWRAHRRLYRIRLLRETHSATFFEIYKIRHSSAPLKYKIKSSHIFTILSSTFCVFVYENILVNICSHWLTSCSISARFWLYFTLADLFPDFGELDKFKLRIFDDFICLRRFFIP